MGKLKSLGSLPLELIIEVCTKLPVKTLVTLRGVCKAWNSMITSHDFALCHLQHTQNNGWTKYLLSCRWQIDCLHITAPLLLHVSNKLKVPILFKDSATTRVVNHVNGVLLMHYISKDYNKRIKVFLWNPAIKKVLEIPPFHSKGWNKGMKFGLGFDFATKDYKVVALDFECLSTDIKVYSLHNRSWSKPKQPQHTNTLPKLYWHDTKLPSATYFEGGIYWLVTEDNRIRKEQLLLSDLSNFLCFNVSTEVFSCIKLPVVENNTIGYSRHSAVLDKTLAVVDIHFTYLHVWKMGEKHDDMNYNWTKQYNLDVQIEGFFGKTESNGLEFRRLAKDMESSYDLYNRGSQAPSYWQLVSSIHSYTESLVLLGEKNYMS